MKDNEIIRSLKSMYEKNKEIEAIQQQRRDEEQALAIEYKVDECNAKRAALAKKYADMVKDLNDEIKAISNSLGEKV